MSTYDVKIEEKDNLYNKVAKVVNNIIPGQALDLPLATTTTTQQVQYNIRDNDGNIIETLDEIPGGYMEGRKIYKSDDGSWTYTPQTKVSLNELTGEITVNAPDFVLERDGFKDQFGPQLETLSRYYQQSPNAVIQQPDGSTKTIPQIIDELNDPTSSSSLAKYTDSVLAMMDQELGYKDMAGNYYEGDRKKYNISDDIKLDDNYFMLRNTIAYGDDVNESTLQAVPKQLAQADFLRALESYDSDTGTVKRGDLMEHAYNRDVDGVTNEDERLKQLKAGLEEYFAQGNYSDTDEFARCVALYEFITHQAPNAAWYQNVAYCVGSFVEGVTDYEMNANVFSPYSSSSVYSALGIWLPLEQTITSFAKSISSGEFKNESYVRDFLDSSLRYWNETEDQRQADRMFLSPQAAAAKEIGYGIASLATLIAAGNVAEDIAKSGLASLSARTGSYTATKATEAYLASGVARPGMTATAISEGMQLALNASNATTVGKMANIISKISGAKATSVIGGLVAETFAESVTGNPEKFYRVLNSGELTDEAKEQLWEDFIGNSLGLAGGVYIGKGLIKISMTTRGRALSLNLARKLAKLSTAIGDEWTQAIAKKHGVDSIEEVIQQLNNAGKVEKAQALLVNDLLHEAKKAIADTDAIQIAGRSEEEILKSIEEVEDAMHQYRALQNAVDEFNRRGLGIASEWYNSRYNAKFADANKAMEDAYETLRKAERSSGITGLTRAGKLAISQETSNYIAASLKRDIVSSAIEVLKNNPDRVSDVTDLRKELEKANIVISKFEELAGGNQEILQAAKKYTQSLKSFYSEANNLLVREGLLNTMEIEDLRASGLWGENGELYAHFQRLTPENQLSPLKFEGNFRKDTVEYIKNYTHGSDLDYMDPMVTARLYMRRYADAAARQNVIRQYISITGKGEELLSAAETEAARILNKGTRDAADKEMRHAVEQATKEIRAGTDNPNDDIIKIFVSENKTEMEARRTQGKIDRRTKKLEELQKGNISSFKPTRRSRNVAIMSAPADDVKGIWKDGIAKKYGDTAANNRAVSVYRYVSDNYDELPRNAKAYIDESFDLANYSLGRANGLPEGITSGKNIMRTDLGKGRSVEAIEMAYTTEGQKRAQAYALQKSGLKTGDLSPGDALMGIRYGDMDKRTLRKTLTQAYGKDVADELISKAEKKNGLGNAKKIKDFIPEPSYKGSREKINFAQPDASDAQIPKSFALKKSIREAEKPEDYGTSAYLRRKKTASDIRYEIKANNDELKRMLASRKAGEANLEKDIVDRHNAILEKADKLTELEKAEEVNRRASESLRTTYNEMFFNKEGTAFTKRGEALYKKMIDHQTDTYLNDKLKAQRELTYFNWNAAKKVTPDFEDQLMRRIVGGDETGTFDTELYTQRHMLEEAKGRTAAQKAMFENDYEELSEILGIKTDFLNAGLDDAVNIMVDKVLSYDTIGKVYQELTEYYGLEPETARRYLALRSLVEAKPKKMKNSALTAKGKTAAELGSEIRENGYAGITSSDRNYLRGRINDALWKHIEDEYNSMRVDMKEFAPAFVDSDKMYDEVESITTRISEYKKDADNIVALQDDMGRVSFVKTDPLLATVMNHEPIIKPLSAFEKANYLLSKTFRLGTTSLNLKSLVNQTFRDFMNAFVGGNMYRTWAMSKTQMADVLGENVVDWIRRSDSDLADYITEQAKRVGKTEEEIAYETIKEMGSNLAPTTSETEVYKRAAAVSRSMDASQSKGMDKLSTNGMKGTVRAIDTLGDKLGMANNWREVGLRNAVFQNGFADAVKRGYSFEQAKQYATFLMNNATTNFGRTTIMFSRMQRTIPFLGAAINGTTSFYRLLSVDPVGVIGRLIGGIVLPTAYLTAGSLLTAEDRKKWKSIKEYEKDDNIIFISNGEIFSVPIPQELSAWINPVRHIIEKDADANIHSVMQLAVNDILGLSPIDLDGFANIDASMLADGTEQDNFFVNNIEPGLAKLFSQLAPVPMKAGMMWATGIDPYTMKKIDKTYQTVNLDTGEVEIMNDYSATWVKKVSQFMSENTPFKISAPMAQKMLGSIIGTAPIEYIDWLTTTGDAVINNKDVVSALSNSAEGVVDMIASPVTVPQYKTRAEEDWKNAVTAMYEAREALLMSDEWQSYQTKKRNATTAEELSKLSAMRDNLTKSYYDNLQAMVTNLQTKYGEDFTAEKYAAVISLSVLDDSGVDTTAYGQYLSDDLYKDAKTRAVDTMYRMGFQSPSDYSVFGYLKTNSNGETYVAYSTPMSILQLRNNMNYAKNLHQANMRSIIESRGLQKNSDAYRAMQDQVDSIYAKGNLTSDDYDAISTIYKQWDAQVMTALYPYLKQNGIDNVLENTDTVEFLNDVIKVPSDFAKTKQGRYFSSPGLNKQAGYAKAYIEYVYNLIEEQ